MDFALVNKGKEKMNFYEVFVSVAMFTTIIMMLVFLILFARRSLVSSGEVSIEINGDPEKTIVCASGGNYLIPLLTQGYFCPLRAAGRNLCPMQVQGA